MNEEAVSVWVRMDGSCSRLRGMYVSTIGEREKGREGKGRDERVARSMAFLSGIHIQHRLLYIGTYFIQHIYSQSRKGRRAYEHRRKYVE